MLDSKDSLIKELAKAKKAARRKGSFTSAMLESEFSLLRELPKAKKTARRKGSITLAMLESDWLAVSGK